MAASGGEAAQGTRVFARQSSGSGGARHQAATEPMAPCPNSNASGIFRPDCNCRPQGTRQARRQLELGSHPLSLVSTWDMQSLRPEH